MSTWSDFVAKVASGETSSAISTKTGINQSSIYRWLHNEGSPSPAHAAKFASVYGADVLDAFVAAEFVTEEDIRPERDLDEMIMRTIRDLTRARVELEQANLTVEMLSEQVDALERRRLHLEVRRDMERQARTSADSNERVADETDGPDPADLIGKIPADAPGEKSEGQLLRGQQDEIPDD